MDFQVKGKIIYREATPAECKDIFMGFRKAVKGVQDEKYWSWLISKPNGQISGYIAIDENMQNLAGGVLFQDWMAYIKGQKELIRLLNFHFVSNGYRKQGIGSNLIRESNKRVATICFCHPNVAGLKIHKQNNALIDVIYRYSAVLHSYEKLVSKKLSPFLSKAISIPVDWILKKKAEFFINSRKISSFTLRDIAEFDNAVNRLEDKISHFFWFSTIRNKDYLNWRYINQADGNYRIMYIEDRYSLVGYIVYLREGRKISIIDAMYDPEGRKYELFWLAILRYFRRSKMDVVEFYTLGNTITTEHIKVCGFFKRECYPVVFYFNNNQMKEQRLSFRNKWYFTLGDCNSRFQSSNSNIRL